MHRLRTVLKALGPALIVGTLAACGGGSTEPTHADSPTASAPSAASSQTTTPAGAGTSSQRVAQVDPCSLITQAEATSAMGKDPGPGSKYNDVYCKFSYKPADDVVGEKSSTILVASFPSDRTSFQAGKSHADAAGYHDVAGVGDDAWSVIGTDAGGKPVGTIFVLKGPSSVTIMFGSPDTTRPVLDTLTTLAKAAVGRL
jgi:Protein of unknown function (DUF3558).